MKLLDQILAAKERSPRELEIIQLCGGTQLKPEYRQEFRKLEDERLSHVKQLQSQAWAKLQELGYKKVAYTFNAAYESGHSDCDDPSDRGSKIGIECPDGSFIDGGAVWTGGLVPAIEKAGI
jgi:hypothetical protein